MAIIWQFSENCSDILWDFSRNFLAILWQLYGNYLAISWQFYRNFPIILWKFSRNYMTIFWEFSCNLLGNFFVNFLNVVFTDKCLVCAQFMSDITKYIFRLKPFTIMKSFISESECVRTRLCLNSSSSAWWTLIQLGDAEPQ